MQRTLILRSCFRLIRYQQSKQYIGQIQGKRSFWTGFRSQSSFSALSVADVFDHHTPMQPVELPCGNTVTTLHNGGEIFPVLLDSIRNAKKEILFEMYWINSDRAGRMVGNALCEAAQRGVAVRLIYDAFGSMDADDSYFDTLKANGIDVMEYNPISPWKRFSRLIRRDHRKMLVIDRETVITGGMNIGNEWLPKSLGGQDWRDIMVKIDGPVAKVYAGIFERISGPLRNGDDDRSPMETYGFFDWLMSLLAPSKVGYGVLSAKILERAKRLPSDTLLLYPHDISNSAGEAWWASQGRLKLKLGPANEAKREIPTNESSNEVPLRKVRLGKHQLEVLEIQSKLQRLGSSIQVITNDGWTERNTIRRGFIRAINAAQDRVTLVTSYFVPCRSIRHALYRAAARGVKVQVVVPGQHTDMHCIRFASHAMYDMLLMKGVRVFEYKPSVLHAKLCIIDGMVTTVGSYNIDYRSWLYNLEIITTIHDQEVTERMENRIEYDIENNCEEIKLVTWNDRPFLKRIIEQFFFSFHKEM